MKRRSSMVMIFVIASTLITLGASGGYQTGADEAESVTVFAAASTTNAITEIGALFLFLERRLKRPRGGIGEEEKQGSGSGR